MCRTLAQSRFNFASAKQKTAAMKNTEYTNFLGSIISSEDSLTALLEMIEDMDLEITGVGQSW
jgi:hypothetical protein